MTPEQLLDLKMAEPDDNGSVVRFKVSFPDSPKTYTYAAVKAGRLWYVTGRDGAIGRGWSELIDLLLSSDRSTIETALLATTLEDLL